MTEQDEIDIYNEGYRDGLRAALKHEELPTMKTQSDRAMEAIAEADYIARVDPLNPGTTFNNDPACFARYCNLQANKHKEFTLIAADMRRHGVEVTEHPLSDFEHVTL